MDIFIYTYIKLHLYIFFFSICACVYIYIYVYTQGLLRYQDSIFKHYGFPCMANSFG